MRVLVLNCGSSSVKFAVIDTKTQESIASGLVENIGVNGHVKAKGPNGNIDFNFDCPTHAEAVAEADEERGWNDEDDVRRKCVRLLPRVLRAYEFRCRQRLDRRRLCAGEEG